MNPVLASFKDVGITCIDADYVRPGLACFYLLQHNEEYAVIETGTSRSLTGLQTVMKDRNIRSEQIRYIIPTHVHLDHAGGAGSMMAALPEAQLLVHPRGARHLIDPTRLVASSIDVYGEAQFKKLYGEIQPVPAARVESIEDGETRLLGSRALEFRHTRGHANHHFCIWDSTSQGWFSGDMYGICYPWLRYEQGDFLMPATTPTQFDPTAYRESIELLLSYKPKYFYLTHASRISFTDKAALLLQQQLEAYSDIATRHGDEEHLIKEELVELTLSLLAGYDKETSPEVLLKGVNQDISLNAQGLAFWQQSLG